MSHRTLAEITSVILLSTVSASAQIPDPHSVAPPEILQMDRLPNAGALLLRFCSIGNVDCVERSTSCHGQCCNQAVADAEGYGCSGDVYGGIPPGFHYSGWRCEMYSQPTRSMPLSGNAGPELSYIQQCTNLR
jgi:hypothetical protein